jgi:hypothetical protein
MEKSALTFGFLKFIQYSIKSFIILNRSDRVTYSYTDKTTENSRESCPKRGEIKIKQEIFQILPVGVSTDLTAHWMQKHLYKQDISQSPVLHTLHCSLGRAAGGRSYVPWGERSDVPPHCDEADLQL